MILKKGFGFAIFLVLFSCNIGQQKGIVLKVINNSNSPISEVSVATSENLDSYTFKAIDKNQSDEGFLNMERNKTDGNYQLKFKNQKGNLVNKDFGYYSNGAPADDWLRIEIQNDTILIKSGNFPD